MGLFVMGCLASLMSTAWLVTTRLTKRQSSDQLHSHTMADRDHEGGFTSLHSHRSQRSPRPPFVAKPLEGCDDSVDRCVHDLGNLVAGYNPCLVAKRCYLADGACKILSRIGPSCGILDKTCQFLIKKSRHDLLCHDLEKSAIPPPETTTTSTMAVSTTTTMDTTTTMSTSTIMDTTTSSVNRVPDSDGSPSEKKPTSGSSSSDVSGGPITESSTSSQEKGQIIAGKQSDPSKKKEKTNPKVRRPGPTARNGAFPSSVSRPDSSVPRPDSSVPRPDSSRPKGRTTLLHGQSGTSASASSRPANPTTTTTTKTTPAVQPTKSPLVPHTDQDQQSRDTSDTIHMPSEGARSPESHDAQDSNPTNGGPIINGEDGMNLTDSNNVHEDNIHANSSLDYNEYEDFSGSDNETHPNSNEGTLNKDPSDVSYKHMFIATLASFVGFLLLGAVVLWLVWRCKVGIKRKMMELPMNTNNSPRRKSNCFKDAWDGLWEKRQQRRLLRHLEESAALLGRQSHQDFLLREHPLLVDTLQSSLIHRTRHAAYRDNQDNLANTDGPKEENPHCHPTSPSYLIDPASTLSAMNFGSHDRNLPGSMSTVPLGDHLRGRRRGFNSLHASTASIDANFGSRFLAEHQQLNPDGMSEASSYRSLINPNSILEEEYV